MKTDKQILKVLRLIAKKQDSVALYYKKYQKATKNLQKLVDKLLTELE